MAYPSQLDLLATFLKTMKPTTPTTTPARKCPPMFVPFV
jgi:hypothetical protein